MRPSNPAEMSKTKASAISATTKALCRRRELPAIARPPMRRALSRFRTGTRKAGARPKRKPLTREMPTAKKKRSRVEMNLFSAGKVAGPERDKRADAHGGDGESEKATAGTKHCAFGEALADEPSAAGAEGDAHRELTLTRDGAREQQASDIHAGYQQDQSHGGEKQPKSRADVADEIFLQEAGGEHGVGVGCRVEAREIIREECEFALRLRQCRSRTQTADDVKIMRAAILRPRVDAGADGCVDVHADVQLKAGRQDADDRHGASIKSYSGADRGRVCGETAAPKPIADHGDGSCTGLIFVGTKYSAGLRTGLKDREEFG